MIDIDELLRADAQSWQRAVEVVRPAEQRRPYRLALVSAVAIAAVIAGLLVVVLRPSHHTVAPTPAVSPASALFGVTWTDEAAQATVIFAPDSLRTNNGCDPGVFNASYEARTLTVGKYLAGTACAGGGLSPAKGSKGYAAYERYQSALEAFDATFKGTIGWRIDGRTLTLRSAKGTSITLTTDGKPAVLLTNHTWTLTRVERTNGTDVDSGFGQIQLRIDSDGSVHTSDECGPVLGHAVVTASTISFGVLAPQDGCRPPYSEARDVVEAILSGSVRYLIYGSNELLIYGRHGGLLEFTG